MWILSSVVLGIIGWMAGSILHELGHVIGAKLAGLQVRWFVVNGVALYFDGSTVYITKSPLLHSAWVYAAGPRATDRPINHLLFTLSGPALSFFGAVVGFAFVLMLWSSLPWVWLVLPFTYVCFLSALPFEWKRTASGLDTDYEIARQIRKEWTKYREFLVVGRVASMEHSPAGFRNLDQADRADLWDIGGDPTTQVQCARLLMCLALIERNKDDARRALEIFEAALPLVEAEEPKGPDRDHSNDIELARVCAMATAVVLLNDSGRTQRAARGFDPDSMVRTKLALLGKAVLAFADGRMKEAEELSVQAWQPEQTKAGDEALSFVGYEILHLIRCRVEMSQENRVEPFYSAPENEHTGNSEQLWR